MDGTSWNIMEHHGPSWTIMDHHGTSWTKIFQTSWRLHVLKAANCHDDAVGELRRDGTLRLFDGALSTCPGSGRWFCLSYLVAIWRNWNCGLFPEQSINQTQPRLAAARGSKSPHQRKFSHQSCWGQPI